MWLYNRTDRRNTYPTLLFLFRSVFAGTWNYIAIMGSLDIKTLFYIISENKFNTGLGNNRNLPLYPQPGLCRNYPLPVRNSVLFSFCNSPSISFDYLLCMLRNKNTN